MYANAHRREGLPTSNSHHTYNFQPQYHHNIDQPTEISLRPNTNSTAWVPPNDRELIIRAKLKTGWNTRNSPANNHNSRSHSANVSDSSGSSNCSSSISDLECLEIEQVLARADKIQQKELCRITNLYERWTIINKPLGNGKTNCFICNCNFGILESSPKICSDCLKNVCTTCSIDTICVENPRVTVYFCKICSEYREFLKKSGAWFSKRLPSEDRLLKREYSLSTFGSSPPKHRTNDYTMINHEPTHLHSTSNINLDEPDQDMEEQDHIIKNISNQNNRNYKKLTDNSDDESQLDSPSNNNTTTDIDLHFATHNNIQHQKTTQSTLMPTNNKNNKLPTQSNSSIKLAEDLQAEYMKESYVQPIKPLFNTCDVPQNSYSKKSLADLSNLADKFNGSVPDLSQLKSQIANSKNLVKPDVAIYGSSIRPGISMMNLSTSPAALSTNTNLGTLQFSVEYIPTLLQLKIHLLSATTLPALDSNGLSDPYVKLHLLPGIARATKLRSKTVYKNLDPIFNEQLHYDGITLADLDTKSLRLTVLDEDKFGYDFIGEYRLVLSGLVLSEVNRFDVKLEAKQELGDEEDTTFRGKINFSLKYSKSACCLYVKVNRCRQLLPMDNGKSSDPFVTISLLPPSSAKELKNNRFKTTVKKKTLDPEFLEEFKFINIDLKQLLSKTIELTVWDKDFGKNDYIGTVTLNQNCTGVELKHFFTMVKNTDIYHEQWHTLQNIQDVSNKTNL